MLGSGTGSSLVGWLTASSSFCGDLDDQGGHAHMRSLRVLLYLSLMAPLLQTPTSSHVPSPTLPVSAGTGPQVPLIQPACKPSGWSVAPYLLCRSSGGRAHCTALPSLWWSCSHLFLGFLSRAISPPHKVMRSCWSQGVPNPKGLCLYRRETWTQKHTQGEVVHRGALQLEGICSSQSSGGEGLAIPLQPGITSL